MQETPFERSHAQNSTETLEPIPPREALDLYLDTRRDELADSTLRSQKCRLKRFVEWCSENDIDTLTDLSGRDLHRYKIYLRDHYERCDDDGKGVSPLTIRTRLSTVRVFLRFCATIDAVPQTLPEKIVLPTVDDEERYRETVIETDCANETLERLRETRFGTREHLVFGLLWRTGIRIGSARAIDLDDIDAANSRIEIVHRPDTGTSLKNGSSGERVIALDDELLDVMTTYVDMNRVPATDDYGREPLFATRHGRPAPDTLRSWVYRAQQPCFHSNECPHGKEIPSCDWVHTYDRDECPSTTMPHNIRRGAITHFLAQDIPQRAVSDRCDVSGDVLREHYDQRSAAGKCEQRRKYFE